MIRNILITALFFFGPAILMFVLRNVFLFLRFWLRLRTVRQAQDANIIDITPTRQTPPGRLFIAVSLLVGLICATLVWSGMSDQQEAPERYIPAHLNEQGKLMPGQMVPTEPRAPDQQ